MLRQLLVGLAISAINIVIHALVTILVIELARRLRRSARARLPILLSTAMTAAALVLMAAHVLEVFVWAAAYWLVDATPSRTGLVYFSFVNYTTLGYGDVIPVPRWHILGPLTAMNGVLLFGWSAAVLFEVLRGALTLAGHGVDSDQGAQRGM